MEMLKNSKTFQHILIIALFSVCVMSVAYYNGMPSGNDTQQHFQFAYTIYDTITDYDFYPSFAASFNKGYGDVGIRFYPPLAYYVLGISRVVIGNWYYALLFGFTVFFFVGGVGTYFWAREEFPPNQSLLAAALFIFAPHHVNQIYNNFLLAEFASSAVIPFCFLYITKVCRRGRLSDIFGLSIAYAALILTHLPLTIIGSIAFGLYAVLLLKRESILKQIGKLAAAVLMGVSASSFYWLRMITELDLVNHAKENYFQNIYSFSSNFLLTPSNLINFSEDSSNLWLAELMLLAILLISIPSIIFHYKDRKQLSKYTIAVASVFIFSVFMTTPLSEIVWRNLSFLQKVQFPWRWLGIISVSAAVFSSGGIIRAAELMKKSKNPLFPLGLGFIFLVFVTTTSFIAKNAVFVERNDVNKAMTNISHSRSFECWHTVWTQNSTFLIDERTIVKDRTVQIEKWEALEREFKISAGKAADLRIATIYYPHWQAEINGAPVTVEKTFDGAISIPLPEAASDIRLFFREPEFVRMANIVSILVWLFLFVGILTTNGKEFLKKG